VVFLAGPGGLFLAGPLLFSFTRAGAGEWDLSTKRINRSPRLLAVGASSVNRAIRRVIFLDANASWGGVHWPFMDMTRIKRLARDQDLLS
jgi:hypothetical protein